MIAARLSHADAGTMRSIAAAIRPRVRARPSEWASKRLRAIGDGSGGGVSHYEPDYMPWQQDIMDVLFLERHKRGVVCMGPAQVGKTTIIQANIASRIETDPCNVLYMVENESKAVEMGQRFGELIAGVPEISDVIELGEKSGKRSGMIDVPFPGGALKFRFAGTASGATGTPYPLVVLDDYTLIDKVWPRELGSPWIYAQGRTNACRDISEVWTFAHPTVEGVGIDALYHDLTDRRRWVISCPNCGATVYPSWHECVDLRGIDRDDNPDPDKAVFVCQGCAKEITRAALIRETWPQRLGGSGRLESELDDEAARQRDYVGIAIHGLLHPRFGLSTLVREYVKLRTDMDRVAWFGPRLGEAPRSRKGVLSAKALRESITAGRPSQIVVPGGPSGVRHVCAGVDVQLDPQNPVLYVRVEGYAVSGAEYVTHAVKLRGWQALALFLAECRVPAASEQGRANMGVDLCAIDCRFGTSHVLEFCRYTRVVNCEGRRVKLLPVEYEPSLAKHRGAPWFRMSPESGRIDPENPHLGPIDRYQIWRHRAVDDEICRWREGRVRVVCEIPDEFIHHLTSQHLTPMPDRHGWGDPGEEWAVVKGRVDDWLQAGAYARAGAVIEFDINDLYKKAQQAHTRTPRERRGDRRPGGGTGGFVTQFMRGESIWRT